MQIPIFISLEMKITIIMIKKATDKHTNKMPGSPNQYEIQKIALGGIAHLLSWALSIWQKISLRGANKKT